MAKRKVTFEEALKRLESIAEEIEQGKIGLEDSISKYEEGMRLVRQCRDMLGRAEQKIQQLQEREDGTLASVPFKSPSSGTQASEDDSQE